MCGMSGARYRKNGVSFERVMKSDRLLRCSAASAYPAWQCSSTVWSLCSSGSGHMSLL